MVGYFGKTLRRPALGNHRAADVKANQLVLRRYAVLFPKSIGFFDMALAGENLQPVMRQIFNTQLRQHVQIHIRRVHAAVQRRKHVPAPFKNAVRRAGAQLNACHRIDKGAALVGVQVYQNVKIMLA